MKIFHSALTAALLLSFSAAAYAQATSTSDAAVAGRAGVEADWKLSKGFHLNLGYELRSDDSFSGIERHQVTLGTSYKVNKWFKVGGGCSFIGHYDSSGDLNPRYRLFIDAMGTYKAGDWRLSLKERLQLTNKGYEINTFQETRNSLGLKSRFKVEYNGIKRLTPYALVELRTVFNDPACSAGYNAASDAYTEYKFKGYTDSYLNRVRGGVGLEWKLNKQNALDFYFLADWSHNKNVDTDKAGTKLKSLTWENGLRFIPGIAYQFSF